MSSRARAWVIGVVLAVIIIAAVAWYLMPAPNPFPVSAVDQPISWALPLPQDAASSTPRLTAQIAQLQKILGQGQYPDSDIHTGIANDYILLGNGKAAYQEYVAAIEASSTYALAYDDMGGLFARIYATSTAERAYAQAVTLAPEQLLFQLSYLDYLAEIAPTAPTTAAAFASAKAQPGGAMNPNLLIAEADWLTRIGSTTAAIADWQKVEQIEPSASVEAQIAQLEKQ